MRFASGAGTTMGTGGMVTKLRAAKIATRFGIGMRLLNFTRIRELLNMTEGQDAEGTYFGVRQRFVLFGTTLINIIFRAVLSFKL